jgi:hypothetical protein
MIPFTPIMIIFLLMLMGWSNMILVIIMMLAPMILAPRTNQVRSVLPGARGRQVLPIPTRVLAPGLAALSCNPSPRHVPC